MFKKMLPWLLIVLVALTLIVTAAVILWNFLDKGASSNDPAAQARNSVKNVQQEKLSAKEVSALTVKIDDITTNLTSKDIVRISFAFQMSDKKAADEFTLLDSQVRFVILSTLSDMTPEEIEGSKGFDQLSTLLINKINPLLQEGKIVKVNITNFILPS